MYLQFPNARLFIHDLLSNSQLSGPAAILQASCEFGLIPTDSAEDITKKAHGSALCACFATAKEILERYFKSQATDGKPTAADLALRWKSIERQALLYEKSILQHDQHTPEDAHCKRMAPALFDLILQDIRRYS